MSKALFKVFALSYLNQHHQQGLLQDCFQAISNPLNTFQQKIEEELREAEYTFDDKVVNKKQPMSIIEEEETDREIEDELVRNVKDR